MKSPAISLLTICGLEELDSHRTRGVTHVLSILDPERPEPQSFWAYDPHRRTTLHFHDVIEPGPGLVLPKRDHVQAILNFGHTIADAKREEVHLLVHCHAGVSRSTAAVAMLLAQADLEEDEDRIFSRLLELRPQAWPNSLMIGFADELLERRGRFSAALCKLYAWQLRKRPETEHLMRSHGRGREVDMAHAAVVVAERYP